jgi:predicted dehydrogenase
VIGYGRWGQSHLEAYRHNPHTELVAVCGRDPARAGAAARRYGAQPYTNVDEMLAEAKPDLVSVILPDEAHFDATLRVLEAGVHCFAEKPLALDRQEALALLAAAWRRGVRFGINFNHRYSTPLQKAHRYIEEGKLGTPAYVLWKFTGGHFPERQAPLHHLLYMQCHGFDMLRYLGGPLRDVGCVTSSPRGDATQTTAMVTVTFASGAVGALIASIDGSYADTHVHEVECVGLGGRIRVTDVLRRFEYGPSGSRDAVEVWEPPFFADADRDFTATAARHIDAFVQALLDGSPVPVPAEDGFAALQAGLAAIESAQSGQRVPVDTTLRF